MSDKIKLLIVDDSLIIREAIHKHLKNLDRLLKETSTTRVRRAATMATHLPPSFPEIADALERSRDVFEAGEVFPSRWIDLTLEFLRS